MVYVHRVKVAPSSEACGEYYHSQYKYGHFHFRSAPIRLCFSFKPYQKGELRPLRLIVHLLRRLTLCQATREGVATVSEKGRPRSNIPGIGLFWLQSSKITAQILNKNRVSYPTPTPAA